jgi:hypothetical protein
LALWIPFPLLCLTSRLYTNSSTSLRSFLISFPFPSPSFVSNRTYLVAAAESDPAFHQTFDDNIERAITDQTELQGRTNLGEFRMGMAEVQAKIDEARVGRQQ